VIICISAARICVVWLLGMVMYMRHCEIAILLCTLTLITWKLIFDLRDVCMSCLGRLKHLIVSCCLKPSFLTMHQARLVKLWRKTSVLQYFLKTPASYSVICWPCVGQGQSPLSFHFPIFTLSVRLLLTNCNLLCKNWYICDIMISFYVVMFAMLNDAV